MKNYYGCEKCPFILNEVPRCETEHGHCPAEYTSSRYSPTGKAILTGLSCGELWYDEEVIDLITGESMGRYDDSCANELFGETDNYCYIKPFLIDGEPVVKDWNEI